jgi:hypothetical protein
MSTLDERGDERGSTSALALELDEIQATVLRYRPEPYYGTHVLMRVDDARTGREFLRRLTPHISSAAGGGTLGMRGSRSGSVTRGSKRSACRRSPCNPRLSAPEWPPVRSSFAMLE